MAYNLTDRTVLITGTSTGIGRTTALHLDQLGCHVLATVRKTSDAEALQAAASSRLTTLILDVTCDEDLHRLRDCLPAVVGERGLWGLVNNAGMGFAAPLEFTPLDKLRYLLEVNLVGVLALTQVCLPHLRQASGRILNVSSVASLLSAPFHGPYSTSKRALNAMSESLRLELAPSGVDVSVLICGTVQTPIWDTAGEASDRVWETLPPKVEPLYGDDYRQLRSYFNQIGATGLPSTAVAEIITEALTANRPKQSYYIGSDAQQYRFLARTSGGIRDRIMLHTIGMR